MGTRARDERGQTGAELMGALLVVSLVVGALASSGAAATVADETTRIVCQIGGGDDCGAAPAPIQRSDDENGSGGEPPQGIPLDGTPLPVLPFPGSVSVSCTYAETSPGACQAPDQPGVSVQATGSVEISRSETALDDEGCPQQKLSISTTLELSANAAAESARAGGSLSAHLGESTKFEVTVSPDAADAIEAGDRESPNPVDPRTIGSGESVQLSREYYTGVGLEAQYRALQVEMGYDRGTRVSSGVQRVSPSTVRVMVGDEDFVRQALSLGIGVDGASVALGGNEELSTGKAHAVDIDISTNAGWAAYQEFIASGTLPDEGTPGTTNPTETDSLNYSDELRAEAQLGNVTIGGQLADSEGHRTETTNADGSVDVVTSARYNNVGLVVRSSEDADGNPHGDSDYSLVLEGGDEAGIEMLQELDGDETDAPDDGNVRIDFSSSQLEDIRELALEELADEVAMNGERPSTEEIAESLADGDGVVEFDGVQYAFGPPYTGLAEAQSPEEILIALYHMGAGGDTSTALYNLATLLLNHDAGLPGDLHAPDCG